VLWLPPMKNSKLEDSIYYLELSINCLFDEISLKPSEISEKDDILVEMLNALADLLAIYFKKSHLKLVWSNPEFKD
jgi:hypothetical protein